MDDQTTPEPLTIAGLNPTTKALLAGRIRLHAAEAHAVELQRTVARLRANLLALDSLYTQALADTPQEEECPHGNIRMFRSHPSHAKCIDCGNLVVHKWVTLAESAPEG